MRVSVQITTFIVFFCLSQSAFATDTKNDQDNYTGDRLSFPVKINATYKKTDGQQETLCIPATTTLRGLGSKGSDNTLLVQLKKPISGEVNDCSTPPKKIPDDVGITIPADIMNKYTPDRFGLTYGALVVPYKYHFSGSQNFKGNSTIGPFLGYRFDKNSLGFATKIVGFLGASAIEVVRDDAGTSKTETLAGFSYGVGILGEIKGDFQLGLVFGWDKVSKDSEYVDDGKIWGAVALGFSFAN